MNAPETLIDILHNIPLGSLQPSKTNPRKRFDEAKLNELAASIKTQGILQPILVRVPGRLDDGYEIVSGERRYRAAKIAGLTELPCMIRALTDTQVLHAQVIENLQRDDLHPLEEAEGFEQLLQQKDDAGNQYTAASIGAEIGKSKAYVYASLKLLALCDEARQAFFDGELTSSTALLIARIPVKKLQLQALKKLTEKATYSGNNHAAGDQLSFRAARDFIQDEFMLDLAKAPFIIDDAALIPKAGACTDCTKRTGNQPELFDDVTSKDVCTDTVCFAMKKAAHLLAIQKDAEAKGYNVVTGKEARKVLPYNWATESQLHNAGLASLDDKIPNDAEDRTWSQALKKAKLMEPSKETGKPAVPKTLVENPHEGGMIETINIEAAIKALREAGFDIKPKAQANAIYSAKEQRQQAAYELKLQQENHYRKTLFDALRAQILSDTSSTIGPKPGLYCLLAERMYKEIYDAQLDIAKLYWPDGDGIDDEDQLCEAFTEQISKLTTQQHFMMMIDMLMVNESMAGRYQVQQGLTPKTMLRVAMEIGIDADEIKKTSIAEFKAAQKKPTAKKAAA